MISGILRLPFSHDFLLVYDFVTIWIRFGYDSDTTSISRTGFDVFVMFSIWFSDLQPSHAFPRSRIEIAISIVSNS